MQRRKRLRRQKQILTNRARIFPLAKANNRLAEKTINILKYLFPIDETLTGPQTETILNISL